MDDPIFWIVLALAIDLIAGDPPWMPHPVRLIGKAIAALEGGLTRLLGRNRLSGLFLAGIVAGGTYLSVWGILLVAERIDHRFALGLTVYFLYASFAARDMGRQSMRVFHALKEKNIDAARKRLAVIVGRDTEALNEKEMVRAAAESVAEGTVDGVLSPLFFAALGGAPLAMAYKAANTLDSMVGYRSEKYLQFGWASARLARFFYPAASLVCGLSPMNCWRISMRDGQKSPSPNAAISEAALAGALGVQLGGTNIYKGVPETRPRLGDTLREPEPADIPRAVAWMYATSIIGLSFFIGIWTLLAVISG